jgi:hypothetical protein
MDGVLTISAATVPRVAAVAAQATSQLIVGRKTTRPAGIAMKESLSVILNENLALI